ncbi:MAG: porin [Variovorax sp.]|nr:MAG: porin [Variovorax sp.]
MKQFLVALAATAVASVGSAQSSVTVFGVVDVAASGYYNKSDNLFGGSATASRTALTNSGYNGSRLGFRGTEDLGGGFAASFWFEGSLNNDDGTGTSSATIGGTSVATGGQNWQRRSTVSLSGGFGEIRLGRDYTPTFWNDTVFDPFGTNGVGTNLISTANGFNSSGATTNGFSANPNYVRASNSIGYFLPPNLGGFYGQLMYTFHEKDKFDPGTATPNVLNNSRTGRYTGGRVGYANGPLDVALAYGSSTVADAFYAGLTTNLNTANFGASYDFGPVKLFGEYSQATLDTSNDGVVPIGVLNSDPKATGWLLGATVPVGPGLIRLAYSAVTIDTNRNILQINGDPKADKFALGYVYNLSKRTALYATAARINNKNGYDLVLGGPNYVSRVAAVPGVYTPKSSTGYDLGIRHAF